ncbi:hypothetical protein GCM10010357_34770 [Streptomyces luteireticuli]|uniref:Uncharacterized protein n=1 Tax=Streptomyces luteireticuli TaxID=173858 RepID=A0ABP3IMG3_9ACTN
MTARYDERMELSQLKNSVVAAEVAGALPMASELPVPRPLESAT